MKTDSTLPECAEGPEAASRFDAFMDTVLAVPHTVIVQRERAYRKKVDANPNRRGPKRKKVVKPSSVSPDPGAG